MLKKKKRLFEAKCDNKLHYIAYITPYELSYVILFNSTLISKTVVQESMSYGKFVGARQMERSINEKKIYHDVYSSLCLKAILLLATI